MPVACSVASEMRVTKVQPPSPAALPRQQVKTPLRWSGRRVHRRRRGQPPAAHAGRERGGREAGVETVPTVEFDMPSVVMVAPEDGSQLAGLASPRCGCSEKSRPFARMASSHGRPARVRA